MRRTIRRARRASWQRFCNEIERTTPAGEVWSMVKRMGRNRRERDYPVLEAEGKVASTDRDKFQILVKAFVQMHSSVNLTEEGRRKKHNRETKSRNIGKERSYRGATHKFHV